MLVLSRRPQESIVITIPPSKHERTIEFVMLEVRTENCAKFGIIAERDCRILRKELLAQGGKK